ncbi:unnamed protein product [Didymodactylos carnosus]|uniref:Uncharacterized protein n=1 Tax=Didymodactylos carnosus TaxID=1234261 RepID=A0A8S2PD66_9BILA|nr:unnamed protein product [Didymodactylos carnosus]CAF4049104.1 unnamed protein product [Didymodactylos carnosus]
MAQSRFADIDSSSAKKLAPIYGYFTQPLVSLEKSLEPLVPRIDQLTRFIKVAKQNCHFPNEHNLTKEESAAVYLYTMEWGEGSFYRVLNGALRNEDRLALKPWFSFLKLFDTAINKLPLVKRPLWRGVEQDISVCFKKGLELTWWSVNSCSLDVNVIKDFLGDN